MLRKGFLRFHRAAEAAGYPALLVVTVVALAIIVSAIALLAIMESAWALGLALTSLTASIALVAGGIDAMFSDVEEPAAERASAGPPSAEPETVVSLPRRGRAERQRGPDRRAA
jgi:hypothetical protein